MSNFPSGKMKALVLAGSNWQKPLVEHLKKIGYYVTIANPVVTECTKMADIHIKCDIKHYENIISSINPPLDLVISDQCEAAVIPCAIIAKHFGLLHNDIDAIIKLTDKIELSKLCKACGFPYPETRIISQLSNCKTNIDTIIKPRGSFGAQGFMVVTKEINDSDLERCRQLSPTKEIIIQKKIEGIHLAIDGLCVNGKHQTLAIGKKSHFRPGVIKETRYPAEIEEKTKKNIIDQHNKLVEMSGVSFGFTQAEYICNNDGNFIIDCGLRGGGNGTSSMVTPHLCSFDPYDLLVKIHLGKCDQTIKWKNKNHASIIFFEFDDGIVRNIKKPKDVIGLKHFEFLIEEGQRIKPAIDNKGKHAIAIILTETKKNLKDSMKQIKNNITVEIEK